MNKSKIGVILRPTLPAKVSLELAKETERLGFHSVWVTEGSEGRDAFTQMAATAVQTERILVGSGIVPIYTRTPILTGMSVIALHEFSGGRAILGLGTSHQYIIEQAHGLRLEQPLAHMREYIQIVRQMMWQQEFSFHGQVFHIPRFVTPVQPIKTNVPIFIAALRPRMLRLAGEMADGVLLNMATPAYIRRAVAEVAAGARAAGRDPATVTIAAIVTTSVSQNERSAAEAVRLRVARYITLMPFYRLLFQEMGLSGELEKLEPELSRRDFPAVAKKLPQQLVTSLAMFGTPEQCRQQIKVFEEAGVQLVVLMPIVPEGNWWGAADSPASVTSGIGELLRAFAPHAS